MTLPEDRLNALALACESASGPDRTLDCAIYDALFIKPGKWDTCYVAKCYTASLDEAMTLVAKTWRILTINEQDFDDEKPWVVRITERDAEFGRAKVGSSIAATPALALTAAALRALALKSGEGNDGLR